MKTWHWILIGGAALIGLCLFFRRSSASTSPLYEKVGTQPGVDPGAPPLPMLNMANPTTAKIMTFVNVLGKRRVL